MQDFLADYYLWVKSLHLVAVMSWMAGMLYLPRLFVYHADVDPKSEASQLLKVMERRLLRYIINPAMIATFLLGILLAMTPGVISSGAGWFHSKVGLVLIMAGIHGMLSKHRKNFERDENKKSAKYFRVLNEVPTLLMILIVILAVVKPF